MFSLKILGAYFRAVRTGKKWVQADVCEIAGVDAATVSRLESGKGWSHDKLAKIADSLGIRLSEAFAVAEQDSPQSQATNEGLRLLVAFNSMSAADRTHLLGLAETAASANKAQSKPQNIRVNRVLYSPVGHKSPRP